MARGDVRVALEQVRARVEDAVARRQARDPNLDDPYRGLYVSDAQADELGRAPLDAGDARPIDVALGGTLIAVRDNFGLSPLDVWILLVALAPDLDARFEKLYAYLHDDITRKRASPGLALALAGCSPLNPAARARFLDDAPLRSCGLLAVDDDDRAFLSRALRVPDRVTQHVLGAPAPDDAPRDGVHARGFGVDRVDRALHAGVSLVYVRDRGDASRAQLVAISGARTRGRAAATAQSTDERVVRNALRAARLSGAVFVAGPVDTLAPDAVGALADAGWPVVLFGRAAWDPSWATSVPLIVEVDHASVAVELDPTLKVGSLSQDALSSFRLGPRALARGARAAAVKARAEGVPLDASHLVSGAREQNSPALERLTRRIRPYASWSDLVLPTEAFAALEHTVARVTHRDLVLHQWLRQPESGRGVATTALFAGESGTGKTFAAEVLAGVLGLDLYVVDLSTVVDKYIGETEKNLDKVFTEAEGVNGVLFFDEADALFGKRSEVSDARDRYANVEIAYLLQRMERFDGLAILATNLHANIDEAFLRRLSVVVQFPRPDAAARRRLWELSLAGIPTAGDIDLDFCAQAFELCGGSIRNVALTAAFLAASGPGAVRMHELIRATQLEYHKLGRLCLEAEFGRYYELVAT
jgi:hypothetical protein